MSNVNNFNPFEKALYHLVVNGEDNSLSVLNFYQTKNKAQQKIALILPIINANAPLSTDRKIAFLVNKKGADRTLDLLQTKILENQTDEQAIEHVIQNLSYNVTKIHFVTEYKNSSQDDRIYRLFTVFVEKTNQNSQTCHKLYTQSEADIDEHCNFNDLFQIINVELEGKSERVIIFEAAFALAYKSYKDLQKNMFFKN